MKEELVSFDTSVLAKEKGFPQDLFNTSWYNELGSLNGRTDLNKKGQTFSEAYPNEESFYGSAIKPEHKKEFKLESYSAPTQSLLQKWLREVHDVIVSADCAIKDDWWYQLKHSPKKITKVYKVSSLSESYKTYEEALEKGLYQALKLIEV